jgi:D-amino-acid dehydrogenase
MSASDHVIVVGGGVIGTCAAYYLACQGRPVTVLERDQVCAIGGGTYANAGLLTPGDVFPLASPGALGKGMKWLFDATSPFYIAPRLDPALLRWLALFARNCREAPMRAGMPVQRALNRTSADLWAEIAAAADVDFGYHQNGWLRLFTSGEGLAAAAEEVAQAASLGVDGEVLDAGRVRELVPGATDAVIGGVMYREDGHTIPNRAVEAVARLAAERGAEFRAQTEVLDVETSGRRVTRLITSRGAIAVDGSVVLAAGAWSPPLGRRLRLDLPIQGAKGYSVTVARPEGLAELPLYNGDGYVAITPMGDRLRFAGTLELAGLDLSIRWRRVAAIRRGAGQVLAGAAEWEPLEIWRGLRPCTPDGLPMIGRSPRHDNLVVAAGHCMLGLSMGPVTGKLVAQIIAGDQPAIDLTPLRIDRFPLL